MEKVAAPSEWPVKRERQAKHAIRQDPVVTVKSSSVESGKDELPCSFLQSTGYYDKVGVGATSCCVSRFGVAASDLFLSVWMCPVSVIVLICEILDRSTIL